MSVADRFDLSVVPLLVAGLLALPVLAMALGFGGPMAGHVPGGPMAGGSTGGWWPLAGMGVAAASLLALLGLGYLLGRSAGSREDRAVAELRAAYARGELSDEEYERRRERLEREQQ